MNNVREVNRINEKELELAVEGGASWHDDYKDSAYIFVGNIDKRLTEGDVIAIFSQYGEVLDINLPRIPEGGLRDQTGQSQNGSREDRIPQQQQQQAGKPGDRRGFGFLLYEDQRSTVLAVDNLNGFNLLGRTIRVDHVRDYKMPGAKRREEEGEVVEPSRNAAPSVQRGSASEEDDNDVDDLDLADPMASYLAASKKEKGRSKEEKEERRRRKEERKRKREGKEMERERRRRRYDSDREDESKKRRSEGMDEERHDSRVKHSQSRYEKQSSHRSRYYEEQDRDRERDHDRERERSRPRSYDDLRRRYDR